MEERRTPAEGGVGGDGEKLMVGGGFRCRRGEEKRNAFLSFHWFLISRVF